jgi:hypothetical protein
VALGVQVMEPERLGIPLARPCKLQFGLYISYLLTYFKFLNLKLLLQL